MTIALIVLGVMTVVVFGTELRCKLGNFYACQTIEQPAAPPPPVVKAPAKAAKAP